MQTQGTNTASPGGSSAGAAQVVVPGGVSPAPLAPNPTNALPGATTTSAPLGGAAPTASSGPGFEFVLIIGGVFVVMIVTQVMAGRKERRRRQDLLTSLRPHDRVQTVGGLIGTIAEVKPDEVVLRVDENSPTRVHVSKAAVQSVLRAAAPAPESR
ncbi:MAG: preprotein translocase subunit YajC [Phycisphaerae bacterium]|nr:preprotein translocase subunit YajC [Phycisphaerae bacterium]